MCAYYSALSYHDRQTLIIELGVQKKTSCAAFKNPASSTAPAVTTQAVLIKNATIWVGSGDPNLNYDILLGTNGKIEKLAANIPTPANTRVIQASGAWVTPGLFDMHSHAGVYSFPVDAQATQDGTPNRLEFVENFRTNFFERTFHF